MSKESVALLGLGTMGTGMATNLLKAGFQLSVYNRTRSKAEVFGAQGARVADTAADAAKGATLILSMLADDTASRETWLGERGALQAATWDALLIECGTVSPSWIVELGAKAHDRGNELLDAPVTGSRLQAAGGQLTFFVGGTASALDRATPVLQAMSKQIVHLGPSGSGAKIKLINNFLCGVQVASLAEGMAWLERSGLDRDLALDILKRGAPGSPLLADISGRMTRHDYTVNFVLNLMLKDLQYAHKAAAELGVELTTAVNARALFEQAAAAGYAGQDMSSVVEPLRAKTHTSE
ncbi:NAD(P)-dependent oxidoreductase [Granulicella sp. dw_53]|uniref:NAD(P)-dependent oxidoreductase n=1 Tax=Granulicella sp. dw_53 TaxID=2719792 RepID=UPI001BD23157|nr:NAD(P)-dependent oxidoreductase [Granulicella sp. dw_53]